jgi:hypothetical protein
MHTKCSSEHRSILHLDLIVSVLEHYQCRSIQSSPLHFHDPNYGCPRQVLDPSGSLGDPGLAPAISPQPVGGLAAALL